MLKLIDNEGDVLIYCDKNTSKEDFDIAIKQFFSDIESADLPKFGDGQPFNDNILTIQAEARLRIS